MNPATRSLIDQSLAYIRDEADREELPLMLEDKCFAAGVSFALGLCLGQTPGEVYLLGEAWQELMRKVHKV